MITFGTGIGLSQGDTDASVTMVAGPGGVSLQQHPFVVDPVIVSATNFWEVLPGTNWVSPLVNSFESFNTIAATAPVGDYTFRLAFVLPEQFSSPTLALDFYTDNTTANVQLNGNSLTFSPSEGKFLGESNTSEASFFQSGVNIVDFTVTNLTGGGFNPVGLDLQGEVTFESQVPEPSTLALCALGSLSMCGAGWRRRRSTYCNA